MGLKDFSTRISAAMDAMPEPATQSYGCHKCGEVTPVRYASSTGLLLCALCFRAEDPNGDAWLEVRGPIDHKAGVDAMPESGGVPLSRIGEFEQKVQSLETIHNAFDAFRQAISDATTAERERCAKIAERFAADFDHQFQCTKYAADILRAESARDIAIELRRSSDAYDAACEEVAEHPNMLTIRLGGATTISLLDPTAMGLTAEEFCAQWIYPVLEMAGMKHAMDSPAS